MNRQTEEKIEKEIKQVGYDVLVGAIIVALIIGFGIGVIAY